MELSACVIVRNEAEALPHWLACMRALADEMVVVDTGSTDDSVALAEAAGARVLHYVWQDDFAAAKNFAIEQARGRWLLLLDADEYIEPADFPALRQALRDYAARPDILGFVLHLVNIDTDNHNRQKSEGWLLRVCRNLPALRYQGAVHEALICTGPGRGTKHMQLLPDVTVWHTGYSAHIIRRKAERNLHILLARQARAGAQPLDDGYLADCYYILQDYERTAYHAARAAQQVVAELGGKPLDGAAYQPVAGQSQASQPASTQGQNSQQAVGRGTRNFALWLQALTSLRRPVAEFAQALAQATAAFPHVPDFLVLAGYDAWARGDYARAERELRASLVRYADFLAAPTAVVDTEMAGMLPNVCYELATIAHWRGRTAEARALAEQGMQANRYFAPNARLWLRLQAGDTNTEVQRLGPTAGTVSGTEHAGASGAGQAQPHSAGQVKPHDAADIISGLSRFYDKRRDAAFLLPLIPHSRPRVRLYYAQQAGAQPAVGGAHTHLAEGAGGDAQPRLTAGEAYLLAGRLPAAAAALSEDVLCYSQLVLLTLAHEQPQARPYLSRAYDPTATPEARTAAERRWARVQDSFQIFCEVSQ